MTNAVKPINETNNTGRVAHFDCIKKQLACFKEERLVMCVAIGITYKKIIYSQNHDDKEFSKMFLLF